MRMERVAISAPGTGEMLVRNHYLSLDPYMRGMMSDRDSYAEPIPLGGVMVGATIAEVLEFPARRLCQGRLGDDLWRLAGLRPVRRQHDLQADPEMPNKSRALGILGMPGLTAWAGLREIGKSKTGETLVVAAAVGPVGSAVGQFAKRMGLRVVGVAGGAKCRIAVEELGFDACIDHRAPEAQLKAAVPNGNDTFNGNPLVLADVNLTVVNPNPNLRLNADGSVDVLGNTPGGTYVLVYQICEKN